VTWFRACSVAVIAGIALHIFSARAFVGGQDGERRDPAADPEKLARPAGRVYPALAPIELDGRLDEAEWRTAVPLGEFIQSQPRAGQPATHRTEVRLLYDEHALYIGAWLADSEPDKLVVTTLERDFESLNNDSFGVALDTFLDRRSSFIFLVNPQGAIRDGQGFDDGAGRNYAWDGVVRVKTHISDDGWSVEMAIPWTTLRFDAAKSEQVWGANFVRRVRRKNEDSYWAPLDRRDPLYTMSKAGTLVGLKPGRTGRDLRVKPYAVTTVAVRPGVEGQKSTFDGGMDFKYAITPRLTLDASYRTDFSHVEVDQDQINLTRFSLFFPEQRDFFTENSGIFAFGEVADPKHRLRTSLRDFSLFHSRRVGLTDQGEPIPVEGGARLTGRIGGLELGILNVQTGETPATGAENFAVVRVRRKMSRTSDVGLMVTNRQTVGDQPTRTDNRSFGVDVNLWPVRPLWIHSYVAASDEADANHDNVAGRLLVAWRDRMWNMSGLVRRVGEGFNPGSGFVQRTGVDQAFATAGFHAQSPVSWVQEINPYVELDYVTDRSGRPETKDRSLGMAAEFRDGSTFNVKFGDRYDRILDDFRVSGGGTVPAGEYDFRQTSISYRSSAGRSLSGSANLSTGGYYDGGRHSIGLRTSWRASYRLTMDLLMDRNRVTLPRTAFSADLFGFRLKYAHTTNLSIGTFLQFNTATRQIVTNYRLNLIHAPLSDLFVVFSDRRNVTAGSASPQWSFAVKLTRMVPF
jgi:hypothetical protein